jgi:hypothetical protein
MKGKIFALVVLFTVAAFSMAFAGDCGQCSKPCSPCSKPCSPCAQKVCNPCPQTCMQLPNLCPNCMKQANICPDACQPSNWSRNVVGQKVPSKTLPAGNVLNDKATRYENTLTTGNQ